MKRIFGSSKGLKHNQIRKIENLYRRKTPPEFIVTPDLARDLSRLSYEIKRQIGLLINRKGKIVYVIVGNHDCIVIPHTREYRSAPGRLNGIRCVHTHLNNVPLTRDDLTDLALLRLDLIAAVTVGSDGLPKKVYMGHDVVTEPAFVLCGLLEVQLLQAGLHFGDGLLRYRKAHLQFGFGQGDPEPSPGLEAMLGGEDSQHLLGGVALGKGMGVTDLFVAFSHLVRPI